MKLRSKVNEIKTRERRVLPTWAAFAIVISISLMLCVSINYRSFSAMHEEVSENDQLTTRIQSVTDENLQLQEEIHNLKSDARVIQREAQRLGIVRTDKVSVPTN